MELSASVFTWESARADLKESCRFKLFRPHSGRPIAKPLYGPLDPAIVDVPMGNRAEATGSEFLHQNSAYLQKTQ